VWRVSGDPTWRPYSFRDGDGEMAGLDVEFSRVLAGRSGARLEWVKVSSWEEAVRRFRAGEIDLLMGTAQTPERDAEMLFTRPYAASPVAVITRLDSPFLVTLRDLAGQRVAAPEGHVTTDYLRKLSLDIRLEVVPDLDAAVRAVADGRADAMVAGLIPSATTIATLGLDDLKVAGLVDARFDLCVAVRRDWPEARDLLDQAIAADPPEVRMERFDRWLEPVMGLQRQAWRWRRLFGVGLVAAATLGLGIVLIGLWNRTLRVRIAEATSAVAAEAAAHAESEKRFRTMFEQAPIGMFRSTPAGAFLSVNALLARMFEYESADQMVREVNVVGISAALFADARQRERIVAAVLASPGALCASQVSYRTRTGRPIEAVLSMAAADDPVTHARTLLGFVQDVTAQVREEASRRQREKLLALGELASGVAHDFNNLLSVIRSESDLLLADHPGDPDVAGTVRNLSSAVDGARALTGRLLRFVRTQGSERPTVYDVREAIRVALELFDTSAGPGVEVVTDFAAGACEVDGYRTDLQNAVLNLCLNSRDAMPDGGAVTVRTRRVELSAADCAALPAYSPAPGAFVEVEVADTGTGMPPEVLASCTEPFFTTKGESGTGLGLWMVHCVAAGQGGALRIETRLGGGTSIAILLPAARGHPAV
ncbi:MAG: transporter substrate-binding domain-containing protein, partial [Anaeromyxobacteraceae bacterium]